MAVGTQTMMQHPRRFNVRAWIAFLLGVVATAAIPVAIELTRKISGAVLLDAVWSIPVAGVAATASLLFARGARGAIVRTLERTGGSAWIRLARILAVAGICCTLSASIAVGVYEVLLRLEH